MSVPTVALLETAAPRVLGETPLAASVMRVARLFSRRVRVLVACWHQLDPNYDGIGGDHEGPWHIRPPFLEFADGEYRVWIPRSSIAATALCHFPASGQHRMPLTPEEVDAERRLAAAGIRCEGIPADTTARALYALARRGTPTNGPGRLSRLGRKDQLEYALRWYEESTGQRIARPKTQPCTGAQLGATLASFAGRDCIIKPANSSGGRGIQVVAAGGTVGDPVAADARFVVQELTAAPLVVDGAKTDLRCYLLVDARDRARSRRVGPILARGSAAPYARLLPEAEITNTSLRNRLGLGPSIRPIAAALAADPAYHAALSRDVERLCGSLIDFVFAWRDSQAAGGHGAPAAAQVMLWGIDVLVSGPSDAPQVSLLEINVYPQLHRGDPVCDSLTDDMLVAEYLEGLVPGAGARHPVSGISPVSAA
ncbi:hypothetical protein [Mycobacterium sp.]|uniref:hypothetical protein n=1 Tax=Mycobacterium sp. TaxID=1785 RepID=UPI003BB04A50